MPTQHDAHSPAMMDSRLVTCVLSRVSVVCVCHVCQSPVFCHVCLSRVSVACVRHVCLSHVSISCVCHVCLSRVSVGPQVENFAQDLFQKADDLDRNGQSDLRTAKAFLASAHVLEVRAL